MRRRYQKPSPLMGEGWVGVTSAVRLNRRITPIPGPSPIEGEGRCFYFFGAGITMLLARLLMISRAS